MRGTGLPSVHEKGIADDIMPVMKWSILLRVLSLLILSVSCDKPSDRSIVLGVFRPGAPEVTPIENFARDIGRPPAIVFWFQPWIDEPAFPSEAVATLRKRGYVPMVSWEPWDPAIGANNERFRPVRIAAGDHDDYVRGWARAAKSASGPILVRFGHEMNGPWYPWGSADNRPEEYVAAFRHVVSLIRAEGASNVRFVWAPNVEYPGSASIVPLYPGDAYVDWVCVDGFNWGTSRVDSRWESFEKVFRSTYDQVVVLAPGKRLMIETASAEIGGDKAAWIEDAFSVQLPRNFKRVEAVLWFDENKETDWRVVSSPEALRAFRQAVSAQTYSSKLTP